MKEQNYSNHRRFVALFHVVTFPMIMLMIVSSVYYTIDAIGQGASMRLWLFFLIISIALLFVFFFARSFSLKAQDRAIRAEENFRHYLLTGKPLDSRLTIRQIIGLRFASDEEFIELAKNAVEKGTSEEDIKKSIKNWKADNYRV
ncbi:MAG: DUF6526 family protein [Candidatus Kapaibacterium sp.]